MLLILCARLETVKLTAIYKSTKVWRRLFCGILTRDILRVYLLVICFVWEQFFEVWPENVESY